MWKAKKQSLVSLSTAEAELISACEGCVIAQSTEAMLREMTQLTGSKLLYVDNLAAIALAEGAGSQRTRHLRVRSNFMSELVAQGELEVEHCPGEHQSVDILTKALPGPRHHTLAWLVGLGDEPDAMQVAAVTQVRGLKHPPPRCHCISVLSALCEAERIVEFRKFRCLKLGWL